MSLTLLAPASLDAAIPELARRTLRLPNLEALLASGAISRSVESTEQWLAAQLGIRGTREPPIAALRLAADTAQGIENPGLDGTNAGSYWLCADPIATTMGMDSVRIDGAVTDLSPTQSEALTGALSEFFARDGLRFVAASPAHWYVRCGTPQSLATTPLWRVVGGSMLAHLPTGPDGPAWRARLNEAQMLLHAHPINQAREDKQLPPVASVWWWGGGSWPAFAPPAFETVVGGPRWVSAACTANGVNFQSDRAVPPSLFQTTTRRTLLTVEDEWEQAATSIEVLVRWDIEWFGALRAALEAGRVEEATLVFPWHEGTLRVTLESKRRPRWRRFFGIRSVALSPPLAETLKAFGS